MVDLVSVLAPGGAKFSVGRPYQSKFASFLNDLAAAGYTINAGESGGYNPRNIAGTNTPSLHSYGSAIDINWSANPRGSKGNLPANVGDLAKKHGLTWGGTWKNNPDPMHFEIADFQRPGAAPGGAAPMALPGQMKEGALPMEGYDGATPGRINRVRQIAEALMAQGLSAAPVGHWTQALARPIAAAVGGWHGSQADDAEARGMRSGNEALAAALTGPAPEAAPPQQEPIMDSWQAQGAQTGMRPGAAPPVADPSAANTNVIRQLLSNPWTADTGQQLVAAQLKQRMTPDEYQQRAAQAQRYGLDVASPEGKAFVLTGKLPGIDGAGPRYGLNPIYGVDAEGNPVAMQPSDQGGALPMQMPPGVTISKTPIKLDAGDRFILLDPITRQPVGEVPKNLAAAEAQKAAGELQGKAGADLPRVEENAERMLRQMEQLENSLGLESAVGPLQGSGWVPTVRGTTADAEALIEQVGGGAFLQAFESLKGGGQITEAEGRKATAALSRLANTKQSDAGYRQAIEDFKREVASLVEIARKRAGGQTIGSPAPPSDGWSFERVE